MDEGVLAAETAIKALTDAKTLSPRVRSGALPGARAWLGNNVWDGLASDSVASPQSAEATSELENVVTSLALAQLKSIFGAAPSEGEHKILMAIQGSIGQPVNVRQKIYDRGIALAEKRLDFNRQRAQELRRGSYYRNPGQSPEGASQSRPQGGQQLRATPPMQGARQAGDGNRYVPDPKPAGRDDEGRLMAQPRPTPVDFDPFAPAPGRRGGFGHTLPQGRY